MKWCLSLALGICLGIVAFLVCPHGLKAQSATNQRLMGSSTNTFTGSLDLSPSLSSLTTIWMTIPCAPQTLGTAYGCLSQAPQKLIFEAYPDTSDLCVAKTATHPEMCLSYGAFKRQLGVR